MLILQNQSIEELANEASLSDDANIARLGQAVIDHLESNIEAVRDLRRQIGELEAECNDAERVIECIRKALDS